MLTALFVMRSAGNLARMKSATQDGQALLARMLVMRLRRSGNAPSALG